jgi:hypothetical protein
VINGIIENIGWTRHSAKESRGTIGVIHAVNHGKTGACRNQGDYEK